MKSIIIKLSSVESIKQFVGIANKYPYETALRMGNHIVNGKSILGVFSLDLSKSIQLDIYSDACNDMMRELKPFLKAPETAE